MHIKVDNPPMRTSALLTWTHSTYHNHCTTHMDTFNQSEPLYSHMDTFNQSESLYSSHGHIQPIRITHLYILNQSLLLIYAHSTNQNHCTLTWTHSTNQNHCTLTWTHSTNHNHFIPHMDT